MKSLKTMLACAACLVAAKAMGESQEVIQLRFTDGIIDYYPVENVSKISFARGIDADSPLYAAVNSMFDILKEIQTIGLNLHSDFGYPAIMLGLDSQTEDLVSTSSGYNWFRDWTIFQTRGRASIPAAMMWRKMYFIIERANITIKENQASTNEEKLLLAQSHAMRSWAYWNLIQTFAPNYNYEPDADGVVMPEGLIDQLTLETATVRTVYSRIMSDIDTAIGYLEDTPLEPAHIDVGNARRYIDIATAYGLRARYNLTMHRYAEAAADARMAIDKSACQPLQYAAAAFPGFNDAKLGNWMWAVTISPDDFCVGTRIVNFTSHMCSLFAEGYTRWGAARACGSALYNYLSEQGSDVRLYWFTDYNGIGSNLTHAQQKVVNQSRQQTQYVSETFSPLHYLNIKFDNHRGKIVNPVPAADVPLMRIEEMYLIEAEGLAMSGHFSEGAKILTEFVSTYRNPAYTMTATDAESLQQEIIWQRRAEFWGEGIAFLDKLRLRLDMDRFDDNDVVDELKLRIRGTSPWMLYRYPKTYPLVNGFDYDAENGTLPVNGKDGEWND